MENRTAIVDPNEQSKIGLEKQLGTEVDWFPNTESLVDAIMAGGAFMDYHICCNTELKPEDFNSISRAHSMGTNSSISFKIYSQNKMALRRANELIQYFKGRHKIQIVTNPSFFI